MDKNVDADRFAIELKEILSEVAQAGNVGALKAVQNGMKTGVELWRQDARDHIHKTYRRHGKTITSGAYARSIRSHMLSEDESHPVGEVGSRSLPGLTHLLENGHARVGGGFVQPVLHIEKEVKPVMLAVAAATAEAVIDSML